MKHQIQTSKDRKVFVMTSELQFLFDLMQRDEITKREIQLAVAKRGYCPADTPLSDYDPEFVYDKLVACWPEVTAVVEEMREEEEDRRHRNEIDRLLCKYGRVDLDDDEDDSLDWIANNAFVYGIPAGIAGFEKSGKSSVATELTVCALAEDPVKFLDYFDVPAEGAPVLYLKYEGTKSEFRRCLRRVEKARGVRVNRKYLNVLDSFPPLDTAEGLSELERIVEVAEGGLVIVDPLFLALRNADWTRAAEVGGYLADIYSICRQVSATPIYVHHFNSRKDDGLQALAGAGIKEHVGQWMLMRKLGRYDHEAGRQRLQMEIGSSRAGFGGRYTLEITEGRSTDPGGRRWETVVTPFAAKTKGAREDAGDDGKLVKAVLSAIKEKPLITKSALGRKLGRSNADIGKAVKQLFSEIEECGVIVRGNATTGYRYRTPDAGRTPD